MRSRSQASLPVKYLGALLHKEARLRRVEIVPCTGLGICWIMLQPLRGNAGTCLGAHGGAPLRLGLISTTEAHRAPSCDIISPPTCPGGQANAPNPPHPTRRHRRSIDYQARQQNRGRCEVICSGFQPGSRINDAERAGLCSVPTPIKLSLASHMLGLQPCASLDDHT